MELSPPWSCVLIVGFYFHFKYITCSYRHTLKVLIYILHYIFHFCCNVNTSIAVKSSSVGLQCNVMPNTSFRWLKAVEYRSVEIVICLFVSLDVNILCQKQKKKLQVVVNFLVFGRYLAKSFKSKRPSLFLSKIFIWKRKRMYCESLCCMYCWLPPKPPETLKPTHPIWLSAWITVFQIEICNTIGKCCLETRGFHRNNSGRLSSVSLCLLAAAPAKV